jgi:hypothetical protein
MKYLLIALLGVVVGTVCAAAALYHSPLTEQPRRAAPESAWSLEYGFPNDSSIALTHDGRLNLPAIPPEIPSLWESTINDLALNVLALTDESGTVRALASRLSVPSIETDLLLHGVIVSDHWLVTVPGEGSFVVQADNNLWPLLKDTFISVSYLGREWGGPEEYTVTAGPGTRDVAEVYGISGRFAGLRGSAIETYGLERFSRSAGIEGMRGKLAISFDASAVDQDSPEPGGVDRNQD